MRIFFSLLILVFSYSCSKSDFPKGTPDCIVQKITKMANSGDASCSVYRYTSNGMDVYLVSPGCCDKFTELYDADCHYLCAPSGGISGQGDGNCGNLNLENETLIWKAE